MTKQLTDILGIVTSCEDSKLLCPECKNKVIEAEADINKYIAEQRIDELVIHSGGKCDDNAEYWRGIELTPEQVTARIATLKKEAEGL